MGDLVGEHVGQPGVVGVQLRAEHADLAGNVRRGLETRAQAGEEADALLGLVAAQVVGDLARRREDDHEDRLAAHRAERRRHVGARRGHGVGELLGQLAPRRVVYDHGLVLHDRPGPRERHQVLALREGGGAVGDGHRSPALTLEQQLAFGEQAVAGTGAADAAGEDDLEHTGVGGDRRDDGVQVAERQRRELVEEIVDRGLGRPAARGHRRLPLPAVAGGKRHEPAVERGLHVGCLNGDRRRQGGRARGHFAQRLVDPPHEHRHQADDHECSDDPDHAGDDMGKRGAQTGRGATHGDTIAPRPGAATRHAEARRDEVS